MESPPPTQEQAQSRNIDKWLWLAIILAILGALWIQGPRLLDPYVVEEDARSFFWWKSLQDPELFRDTSRYQQAITDVQLGPLALVWYELSPGYSLLFQAGSQVVSPVLFSKLLIFPLLLVSVYFLYRIATLITDRKTAFVLCLAFINFNLASSTTISAVAGLQRSFLIPFLLALLYYLMTDRLWAAAATLFLSSTIYAPAFFLGSVLYGLVLLNPGEPTFGSIIQWRHAPPFAVAVVLSALILAPAVVERVSSSPPSKSLAESNGDVNGRNRILTDPQYRSEGRRQLFEFAPYVGRGGIVEDAVNGLHLLFLSILALGVWRLLPASLTAFPRVLKLLVIASLICFSAAWAAVLLFGSFQLYLPSRYMQAALPLFLIVYIVVHAGASLNRLTGWLSAQSGRWLALTLPLVLFALAVALFGPRPEDSTSSTFLFRHSRTILLVLSVLLLLLGFVGMQRKKGKQPTRRTSVNLTPRAQMAIGLVLLLPSLFYVQLFHAGFFEATPAERELYQYLETLPKDSLIWGSPCTLSGVPLFAGRQVLFSCEDPHEDDEVVMAALQAYYAENPERIRSFCNEYGVEYLVINTEDFEQSHIQSGPYFFEPHNSQLQSFVKSRFRFVLSNLAREKLQFSSSNLHVTACQDI